jgi:hypothetical protein
MPVSTRRKILTGRLTATARSQLTETFGGLPGSWYDGHPRERDAMKPKKVPQLDSPSISLNHSPCTGFQRYDVARTRGGFYVDRTPRV